jgi:hypothetical protein
MNQIDAQNYIQLVESKQQMMKEIINLLTIDGEI